MARLYLAHTIQGVSMRALARDQGMHASTILRRIRKQETRRDDPLVDEVLSKIERSCFSGTEENHGLQEPPSMPCEANVQIVKDDSRIVSEAKRILRRLCETGAFLAIAPGLEQAVVFRDTAANPMNKIAVVARDVAHAFALNDWIEGRRVGKIGRYVITAAGRAALSRILADDAAAKRRAQGFAEDSSAFRGQHQDLGERWVMEPDGSAPQKIRVNLAESPVTTLARKKGLDGMPFLSVDMIEAGERLREDFEVAQLGPRVTQNWDRFLTASVRFGHEPSNGGDRPVAARDRVSAALSALGPGLADIAFRCCCFLEGLETAEKRLNWSARSAKVVLRIALGRLADHYGISPMKRVQMAG